MGKINAALCRVLGCLVACHTKVKSKSQWFNIIKMYCCLVLKSRVGLNRVEGGMWGERRKWSRREIGLHTVYSGLRLHWVVWNSPLILLGVASKLEKAKSREDIKGDFRGVCRGSHPTCLHFRCSEFISVGL